jgi:hypothetical protein
MAEFPAKPKPQAFFDATGSHWQRGSLVGKPATMFTSVATQGGGIEVCARGRRLGVAKPTCIFCACYAGLPSACATKVSSQARVFISCCRKRWPSSKTLYLNSLLGTPALRAAQTTIMTAVTQV